MPGEGTCTSDSDCYMSTYNYCGYDNCHNSAVFSAKTIYRNLITLASSDRYQTIDPLVRIKVLSNVMFLDAVSVAAPQRLPAILEVMAATITQTVLPVKRKEEMKF